MAGKNLIEQFQESSISTTTNNIGLVGRSSDETPQLSSVLTPNKNVGENFIGIQSDENKNIELTKITLEKQNVRIKGKYPEYNYVTIDLADFSELTTGTGNIYIPLPKTPKPTTTQLTTTTTSNDTGSSNVQVNTLGAGEGSATITQTNFTGQYPPFGIAGYFGEIRITPDGRYFIWILFNGVGSWRPYEPGSGGGAASTSGGVGASSLGGGSGDGTNTGFGGGSGNINPNGSPSGGRPGIIP